MNEAVPQSTGGSAGPAAVDAIGKPWGFWATAGFGVLILALFVVIQTLVGAIVSAPIQAQHPDITSEQLADLLEGNGFFLAAATCSSAVLCTALILFLARMRRDLGIRNYLALYAVPIRKVLLWVVIGVAVALATDEILRLAGRDTIPEFMIEGYRTAGFLPLFWIALVIAAPVFEEFLFRGFLFRGWVQSRLRQTGTILLTSLVFASIHLQYEAPELLVVLVYGGVLGLARARTGSVTAPLAVHMAINLVAMIHVAQVA